MIEHAVPFGLLFWTVAFLSLFFLEWKNRRRETPDANWDDLGYGFVQLFVIFVTENGLFESLKLALNENGSMKNNRQFFRQFDMTVPKHEPCDIQTDYHSCQPVKDLRCKTCGQWGGEVCQAKGVMLYHFGPDLKSTNEWKGDVDFKRLILEFNSKR